MSRTVVILALAAIACWIALGQLAARQQRQRKAEVRALLRAENAERDSVRRLQEAQYGRRYWDSIRADYVRNVEAIGPTVSRDDSLRRLGKPGPITVTITKRYLDTVPR